VQFLLGRCRSGAERRLRYIIYNRRIWSASSGWVQKRYTGASAHTEHAHFSASYTSSLEASTASWHLEDIPVALTAADKAWITSTIAAQTRAAIDARLGEIAKEVLIDYRVPGTQTPDAPSYQRNLADVTADVWAMTMRGNTRGGDPVPANGVFGQILEDQAELHAQVVAHKQRAGAPASVVARCRGGRRGRPRPAWSASGSVRAAARRSRAGTRAESPGAEHRRR
jgi:hypothetical protein